MYQKIGHLIRYGYEWFETWRMHANSRNQAKKIHTNVIEKKSYSAVTDEIRKKIEKYSKKRFGDSGYSAWLELYTELREEFIEGWIPDDYYTYEMIPKMNPRNIADISNLKTFEHRIFGTFSIQPLVIKINGRYFDHKQKSISFEKVKRILHDYDDEIVLKKDFAPSGREILFKHARDVTSGDFLKKCNYLVQPSVEQHKELARLHPESVNTIRVTTYFDGEINVLVKHITLRFGKGGIRISNMTAGGLSLFLDKEGKIISNAYNELAMDAGEVHPTTGVRYKELHIPGIPESVQMCTQLHHRFPYVRFIAWDVFIDSESKPKLIEWNAWMPGIWEAEALIGPLWPEWKV